MHNTVKNLIDIQNNIRIYINKLNINNNPKIVAVSKTFKIDKILPLIKHGHIDFGENKVQEAIEKWSDIKNDHKINLHMVGKLQTNKVKYAVKIFDYIHSLDSIKLAKKISEEQKKIKKSLKLFIQLNIGNEEQKSGIRIEELLSFYNLCKNELKLNIIGLMCLPPIDENPVNHFKKMAELSNNMSLKELSMGMSSDYLEALKFNSTFIRIGSKIFGERN